MHIHSARAGVADAGGVMAHRGSIHPRHTWGRRCGARREALLRAGHPPEEAVEGRLSAEMLRTTMSAAD